MYNFVFLLQRSTVDKLTNTQILMLFFILVVLCVTSAVFNEFGTNFSDGNHWYLGIDPKSKLAFSRVNLAWKFHYINSAFLFHIF